MNVHTGHTFSPKIVEIKNYYFFYSVFISQMISPAGTFVSVWSFWSPLFISLFNTIVKYQQWNSSKAKTTKLSLFIHFFFFLLNVTASYIYTFFSFSFWHEVKYGAQVQCSIVLHVQKKKKQTKKLTKAKENKNESVSASKWNKRQSAAYCMIEDHTPNSQPRRTCLLFTLFSH